MNIVSFLIEDHVQLGARLELMARTPLQDFSRELLLFLEYFEIHEDIEEEIVFPRLARIRGADCGGLDFDYEKDHTEMWRRLSLLKDAMGRKSAREAGALLEDFRNFASAHMRCEEEILFPILSRRLTRAELLRMGRDAERKMDEFFAQCKKQGVGQRKAG